MIALPQTRTNHFEKIGNHWMLLDQGIKRIARHGEQARGSQRRHPCRTRLFLQQRHLAKKLARSEFGEHVFLTIVERFTDLYATALDDRAYPQAHYLQTPRGQQPGRRA